MNGPKELLFATAGIPISAKGDGTARGIEQVGKLGLGAMEIEFVRQIYIKKDATASIAEVAKKNNILLTCHAPYFINLNAKEKKKLYASYGYISNSAIIISLCGGWSACFHAGYYMKDPAPAVYKIWVRPEVSGRVSQFGSLQEILKLSQELDQVAPCIDFSHLHARTNGKFNTLEEFRQIHTEVEKALGKEGLQNMHIHVSGIAYGEKGEKNHLILKESDMNYKDLCKVWKEFKVKGVVVCESPNIEKDALLLKKTYEKA